MRLLSLIALMLLPITAFGEEADASLDLSDWRTWVGAATVAVVGVLSSYLVKWLRAKSAEAEAKAAAGNESLKDSLEWKVRNALFNVAADLAESELVKIAQDVAAGNLSSTDEVKARLHALGDKALERVKAQFSHDDVDLVAEFGEAKLNEWLRTAVNKVNPFEGKPTAEALLAGGAKKLVDGLVDNLSDKAKDYLN